MDSAFFMYLAIGGCNLGCERVLCMPWAVMAPGHQSLAMQWQWWPAGGSVGPREEAEAMSVWDCHSLEVTLQSLGTE